MEVKEESGSPGFTFGGRDDEELEIGWARSGGDVDELDGSWGELEEDGVGSGSGGEDGVGSELDEKGGAATGAISLSNC